MSLEGSAAPLALPYSHRDILLPILAALASCQGFLIEIKMPPLFGWGSLRRINMQAIRSSKVIKFLLAILHINIFPAFYSVDRWATMHQVLAQSFRKNQDNFTASIADIIIELSIYLIDYLQTELHTLG